MTERVYLYTKAQSDRLRQAIEYAMDECHTAGVTQNVPADIVQRPHKLFVSDERWRDYALLLEKQVRGLGADPYPPA